jgi:hypothetical protein
MTTPRCWPNWSGQRTRRPLKMDPSGWRQPELLRSMLALRGNN